MIYFVYSMANTYVLGCINNVIYISNYGN